VNGLASPVVISRQQSAATNCGSKFVRLANFGPMNSGKFRTKTAFSQEPASAGALVPRPGKFFKLRAHRQAHFGWREFPRGRRPDISDLAAQLFFQENGYSC
jgi:hypothetical protein